MVRIGQLFLAISALLFASAAYGQGTTTPVRRGSSLPTTCSATSANLFYLTSGSSGLYTSNTGTTTCSWTIVFNTALPNGTTATTQASGDATSKVATDEFVAAARIGTGDRSFYATDFGVKADANYSCVATFTSGSKTVTTDSGIRTITNTALTSNVATYTSANVFLPGQSVTVAGTTNGGGIFNVTGPVVSANSTTFTLAITHANVGSSADSGTATGPSVDVAFDPFLDATDFYFVTNEPCAGVFGSGSTGTVKSSGQFTSASGHTAQMANNASASRTGSIVTGQSCQLVWARHDDTSSLNTWFAAVTQNGICGAGILPAGNMYFTAPIVNSLSDCGSSTALSANMTVNGFTINGQGPGQTLLIPAPSLDAAGAVPASGNRAIIFGTNAVQGVQLTNFGIYGGGNTDITNGASKCILSVGWLSSIQNVLITDWGNTSSGTGASGLCMNASYQGPSYVSNFMDYNGGQVCGGFSEYISLFGVQCFTFEGLSFANGDIYSSGSMFSNGLGGGGSVINVLSNANWYSTNDAIFAGGGNGGNQWCVTAANTIFLTNLRCVGGGSGGSGGGIRLNGSIAHATHVNIDTHTYAGPPISSQGAGSQWFDECGNVIAAGSGAAGSSNITYFGSCSTTGTTQTTGNIALTSGWDTSTKSAISGSSALQQFTITAAGTPTATPRITITHPVAFLTAPICSAVQVGGTQGIQDLTVVSTSTTTAVFDWNGTPVAGNTLIIQVRCSLP